MDSESAPLVEQARKFAGELTATVRAISPDAHAFAAKATENSGQTGRVFVRQDPASGIDLHVDGAALFRLTVAVDCSRDSSERFLAVDRSAVIVRAVHGSSEPLFRYDYERRNTGGQACSHIQVHAHRDAFSHLMATCGRSSMRARRRADGNRLPQLSDLHFPLGGHRFRPCLEDVLQMLVDEFGIDAPEGALDALADGREGWRRLQLAAAVRDAPETAADALAALDYEIGRPKDGPKPHNLQKLRAL